MAVRTRFKLVLSVSSSANEEKDLGYIQSEQFSDVFGEGGSWKTVVPVSTTDQQLNMPNIADVKLIAIRTTSVDPTLAPVTITIKKNSNTGEAIDIVPVGPTATTPKEGWLLLTTTGITAVYATNGSATTAMNVTVFCAGD